MTKRKTGSNKSETISAKQEGASSTSKKASGKQAAKKPVIRSATGTNKTKAKSTTAKPRAKSAKKTQDPNITTEQRVMMIAEAAYYNALNSDYDGQDMRHWLQAEADIDARFHIS